LAGSFPETYLFDAFQSAADAVLAFLSSGVTDASWFQIVIFTLVVTHITIAAVTIYLHRSQAHRGLDLHPAIAHFFRFWLWATTGMMTSEWVAIHRKHHAKCETVEDPHSPQTRGLKKVLLEGAELYRAESRNRETIEKYRHGTPDDWMERNVYERTNILGVSLMLIADVILFGAAGATVWAVQMIWIPFFAAGVINGIGHFWGYRNFGSNDASRNVFPIGILIGGEELHNNHHTYGTSARLSNKWYEFDIGWFYIKVLEFFRLATIRKVAPKPQFVMPRPHLDLDALQAVIAHRYDVMAKYAKSVRRAYSQEKHAAPALRTVKRSLNRDAAALDEADREKLQSALADSHSMKLLYEMRLELNKLWERSSLSTEQLLAHLQAWCHKAEQSGHQSLREMSMRLRSYA
jgi:stearoyl-CoA desaturase (delta-9 desaturase)